MVVGGKAPMVLAATWSFVIMTCIIGVLRCYTRCINKQLGLDDYAYFLSWIIFVLYTVFISLSATRGFGQPMPGPSALASQLDDAASAVRYVMMGQTCAVIGMAIAQLSVGFLLLRVVVTKRQRIPIWVATGSLSTLSMISVIIFWAMCKPTAKVFNRIQVPGVCKINMTALAITLGVWCVATDVFFAIYTVIIFWGLNLKCMERVKLAASSVALSIFAGAFAAIRTWEVATRSTANYTLDTVPLIIWTSADLAATLLCSGISVLRPAWRKLIARHKGQQDDTDGQAYGMGNIRQGLNAGDNQSAVSILGSERRCGSGSVMTPGSIFE